MPQPLKTGRPRAVSCDILVIGAGPAGSAAALTAASTGAEVLMIDRRREVGMPPQCAGFLPLAAAGDLSGIDFDASVINRVQTMLTFTPDGGVEETLSPGYIIRRDRFDRVLAEAATAAGATVITRARASSHEAGVTKVMTSQGTIKVRSAVIVGADGPRSITGSWIGSVNRSFIAGIQWTLPLKMPLMENRIYFDQRFPGGYGWLFPGRDIANVGIGVEQGVGVQPIEALKWFVGKMAGEGLVESGPLSVTGGLIPVGGLREIHCGHMVLSGDAAGLCHPITGAGIAFALQSGRWAGEAAARWALGGGSAALAGYAGDIATRFEISWQRAISRRQLMYENHNDSVAGFCRSIKQGWFAFASARTY
jgi:geranylgeranyl reductase family protein